MYWLFIYSNLNKNEISQERSEVISYLAQMSTGSQVKTMDVLVEVASTHLRSCNKLRVYILPLNYSWMIKMVGNVISFDWLIN